MSDYLDPMVIDFDPSVNCAYLHVMRNREVARTVEANDAVNLDFDAAGELIGVEVMGATIINPAPAVPVGVDDEMIETSPHSPVGVQPDHPHPDPGDGREQCETCGQWVWLVTHSCKGYRYAPTVPVVHPEPGEGAHERAFADARAVLTVEGYGRIGPQVLDAIVAAAVAAVRADTAAKVQALAYPTPMTERSLDPAEVIAVIRGES